MIWSYRRPLQDDLLVAAVSRYATYRNGGV
jgi:hypothetical protein